MYNCNFCKTILKNTFINLGPSPIANHFLEKDQLTQQEHFYPLHLYICHNCALIQLPGCTKREKFFKNYAYFSSYSSSWVQHAKNYVNMILVKLNLNSNSFIIEVASNDGYLLQFIKEKNIAHLGIEPAENIAQEAQKKGINTISHFFGIFLAKKLAQSNKADLIIANNVAAHVPDINDFISGFELLLKEEGVATFEFHHVLNLVKEHQFDTIYHEHYSYFSLYTFKKICEKHNLKIFDVEQLPTHGGSLRVFTCKKDAHHLIKQEIIDSIINAEKSLLLHTPEVGPLFTKAVQKTKQKIKEIIQSLKNKNLKIVCYGAPAKGNTLLNFCQIKSDTFEYTVDKNPYKQDKFLPGTHIPIKGISELLNNPPDAVFILPWNIKNEIMQEIKNVNPNINKFIIPIPNSEIIENNTTN